MIGNINQTKTRGIMQTLEQFKDWFVANKFPLKPPFSDPIRHTDISISFVWYRAEPWQVELYLVKPNTVAPVHTHPDFDSLEFYISGTFKLTNPELDKVNLEQFMQTPAFDGKHRLYGQTVKVPPDFEHGGVFGHNGAAFWSIQKWNEGVTPTSATKNWEGETIGEHHEKLVNEKV
jgi:hypothetical protein